MRSSVLLISLGGTIAMTPTGADGGVSPSLDGDDLVAAVPGLDEIADLHTIAFRRLPGAHLKIADLIELSELLNETLEGGRFSGAVITQGTDTIEETAFILDLMLVGEAPVVVTGAMRNPSLPSADGAANLLAAVAVVSEPAARGLGCLVVLDHEIHAASWVQKSHSTSLSAFTSHLGPIGRVVEGKARIEMRPASRAQPVSRPLTEDVDVALVTAAIDDSGAVLDGVTARVDGVVIEALGAGHLPTSMLPALDRLLAKLPVVLATRTGDGEVLRSTYDFPGSERDLLSRGVISAGRLDGPKARVLTTLVLASGGSSDELDEAFAMFHGGKGKGAN